MKKCLNCGTENNDSNSFCAKCGSVIKSEGVNENTAEQNNVKKPMDRKKIFKIVSLILVVICAVGFSGYLAYGYMLKKNPVKWVGKGIEKYSSANTIYSTSKTKVVIDATSNKDSNARMVAKMIEGMSIQSKTKLNKKTKETLYDVTLNFNEQPILNGKIYTNDKEVVVEIPALYNKNLYFELDELTNAIKKKNGGQSKGNIDIEKYKALLDLNNSKDFKEIKKNYTDFLYDNVNPLLKRDGEAVLNIETENGKKDTVKCEKLAFDMDLDKATELLNKILLKIADDKNVKNLLSDKMNEFFVLVEKNNDYDKFNLTKEKVSDAKAEFNKEYDKAMTEMKSGLKNLDRMNTSGMNFKINSDIFMDSKNRVRGFNHQINIKMNGAGSIKIINENVINSIDERINIEKLSTKDGLNLYKASDRELNDMIEEMKINLQGIASKQFGI